MKMTKWYAVMMDKEDCDWGTGSYDLDKAVELAARYRLGAIDGVPYTDAYIDIVEDGNDPISIGHIETLTDVIDMDDINGMRDFTLLYVIDQGDQWDVETMNELIKRAQIYDEESGIKDRWEAEPDGIHDIQDFFDEAFDIIRIFHAGR